MGFKVNEYLMGVMKMKMKTKTAAVSTAAVFTLNRTAALGVTSP